MLAPPPFLSCELEILMEGWFITGVGSGLGRALSEALLARGDCVAGTARDAAAVADLASRYPDRFWSTVLEMTGTGAISQVVVRAFAHFERIDAR